MTSVARKIPDNLQRKIRYVATVRNKSIHEEGYEPDNIKAFLATARSVSEALQTAEIPRPFAMKDLGGTWNFGVRLLGIAASLRPDGRSAVA